MPTQAQLLEVISIQSEIARLGLDLGGVMSLIAERTLLLVGADGAAIELAEGDEMVYRAASGIAKSMLGLRLRIASSMSGLCVTSGEIQRCDDSETDSRVDRAASRQVGLRSMLVMPLKHDEQIVGVLKAISRVPAKFTDSDSQLLRLLTDVVAASMFFATKYDADILFHRATHDTMTGLASRSLFMDRLRHAIARGTRDGCPAAVLMLDMDGLKQVNDTFGHRASDAIITEFALRLQKAARTSDTVARVGGDEFAILLTPNDGASGIEAAIERLHRELDASFSFENHVHKLNTSIGAAEFAADGTDIDRLIEVADQRMYANKKQRRRHIRQSAQYPMSSN